jgi:SagB-type dehydrogenase family enzyme
MDEDLKTKRGWLKSDRWAEWAKIETDQVKKIPPPPFELPCPEGAETVALVPADQFTVGSMPFIDTVRKRKSRRKFTDEPITLEELSFLLWSTQGLQEIIRNGMAARRTVPSGGCRHPFETYLVLNRVEGVEPGLYRYQPIEHRLCRLEALESVHARLNDTAYGKFVNMPAALFIWSVIPYRTEWRYSIISDKIIALDAGHVCQSLYLACESVGLGTCAYDGYDQSTVDRLLNLDGEEEFTIYLATVGRPAGD